MLDKDLAIFYGISTKVLNQAVKRNKSRFPEDFMFQLTWEEENSILHTTEISGTESQRSRSQIVTLETLVTKRGINTKYLSNAFTEHGITMLASILNSEKAIAVNIQIIRIFIHMRHFLQDTENIQHTLTTLELEIKKELQNLSYTNELHEQYINNLYDLLSQLYISHEEREKEKESDIKPHKKTLRMSFFGLLFAKKKKGNKEDGYTIA